MDFVFTIPRKFAGKIASGAIRRIGGNLHESTTGKIVGHLQQAGQRGLEEAGKKGLKALNPVSAVTDVVSMGSGLYENVQNEQIKDMLEGVQMMAGATLAISAVNLGVSSMGFVVMSRKLDGLKRDLTKLEAGLSRVEDFADQVDLKTVARERSELVSLLKRGDEAWSDRDGGHQRWRLLEGQLHAVEHYYRALLGLDGSDDRSIFSIASIPLQEAISAHDAMAQLVAARIKTLVALDELQTALVYSREYRDWLRLRFRDFTAPAIVDARYREVAERDGKELETARMDLLPLAKAFIKLVRGQQVLADFLVELLETLLQRGDVDGREYVRILEEESEHPLLIVERPD